MNTETKPAHTPAPWLIRNCVVTDSTPLRDGKFVGQCPLLDTCEDVAANRRHVVRCVNAHDSLVEVAKRFMGLTRDCELDEEFTDLREKARAALALSKS